MSDYAGYYLDDELVYYEPGTCHPGACVTNDFGDGEHNVTPDEAALYIEAVKALSKGFKPTTRDEHGHVEVLTCGRCGSVVDRKYTNKHLKDHENMDSSISSGSFDWRYLDGR